MNEGLLSDLNKASLKNEESYEFDSSCSSNDKNSSSSSIDGDNDLNIIRKRESKKIDKNCCKKSCEISSIKNIECA